MRIALTLAFTVASFAAAIGAGLGLADNAQRRAAARECVHASNYTDTAVARCYTDRGVPLPAAGKN